MGALQTDTEVRRDGSTLKATLSRDWEIWGPNGGYLAAIALRAAGATAPPGHRPASFSCQYLAVGAFEDVDIDVEPLRQGRSAWCLSVALRQGERRLLQAQVWTTDRSEGPVRSAGRRPDVPPPASLKSFTDLLPPDAPRHRFWENLDGKPLLWLQPGEVDPRGAVQQVWQRFREFDGGGDPFLEHGRTLILIDTLLWPTHHRALETPPAYIAPSLDLSVWMHANPGPDEWLLLDVHADTAGHGLIHGGARVWSEDGRLLATGGGHMLVTPLRA